MVSLKIDSSYLINCIKINEKYSDYETLKADFIKGDKLITKLLFEYNKSLNDTNKNENISYTNLKEINQNKKETYKLCLLNEQNISSNNIHFNQLRLLNKTNLEKYNCYCKTLDINLVNFRKTNIWKKKNKVIELMSKKSPIEELPNYDLMDND